jgi:hypothetical protein
MYVPRIKKNLISLSTITYQCFKVEFVKSSCQVKDMQNHYKVIEEGIPKESQWETYTNLMLVLRVIKLFLSRSVST